MKELINLKFAPPYRNYGENEIVVKSGEIGCIILKATLDKKYENNEKYSWRYEGEDCSASLIMDYQNKEELIKFVKDQWQSTAAIEPYSNQKACFYQGTLIDGFAFYIENDTDFIYERQIQFTKFNNLVITYPKQFKDLDLLNISLQPGENQLIIIQKQNPLGSNTEYGLQPQHAFRTNINKTQFLIE